MFWKLTMTAFMMTLVAPLTACGGARAEVELPPLHGRNFAYQGHKQGDGAKTLSIALIRPKFSASYAAKFNSRDDGGQAYLAALEDRLQEVANTRARNATGEQTVKIFDDEDRFGRFGLKEAIDHRLQARFELTSKLRARDERTRIELPQAGAREVRGDIAAREPLREGADQRRLSDPRFADDQRVVFGAALDNLQQTTKLRIPPNRRVERACPRYGDEIAGELTGPKRRG